MMGPLIPEQILRYYEAGSEDGRLRSGGERLELLRIQDILRRVLPAPPATILDVGGATGVHAQWLAAESYTVHLIDPVAAHVRRDRQPFTTAFLHHPDELANEILASGLRLDGVYMVEGAAWLIDDLESWLDDPEKRELLLWGLRRIEHEPTLLGASRHLLAVARTPDTT